MIYRSLRLLIVEDDQAVSGAGSQRAMETRGFTVTSCDSVSEGLAQIARAATRLCRGGPCGPRRRHTALMSVSALEAQETRCARHRADRLRQTSPNRVTAGVITGAVDYLSKPADCRTTVVAALLASGNQKSEPPSNPMSAPISRALGTHPAHLRNVQPQRCGDGARRPFNMHRRTLQRILAQTRCPSASVPYQNAY
jgi:two-component system response regulator RegA